MDKVKRNTINANYAQVDKVESIVKSGEWSALDCHSYAIRNTGNVNVTVDNIIILRPGEWFSSGTENPEIINRSTFKFEFDKVSPVFDVAAVGGTNPPPNILFDPNNPPARDTRITIIRSYLNII